MILDTFTSPWQALVSALITAVGMYATVIVATRVNGLRSFSTMSAFDFAMTVAIGSAIAGTATSPSVPLTHGMVVVVTLFLIQNLVAQLRRRTGFDELIDNEPILLVRDGAFLDEHLREARVTRADVLTACRRANVRTLDQVQAVVLETTGDVSVLHRDTGGVVPLDRRLLEGVRGAPLPSGG